MTRSKGHTFNPHGLPLVVPDNWIRRGRVDNDDYVDTYENTTAYELTLLQRLFVTMEYPNSSVLSQIYAWSHTLIILLCVVVSYLGTSAKFQYTPTECPYPGCDNDPKLCPNRQVCAPESDQSLWEIDIACYVFYSFDIGVRMLLSPLIPARILGVISHQFDKMELRKPPNMRREEPSYTWYEKSLRYLFSFNNIIDLVATLPYFVELCMLSTISATSGNSAIIVTTVRLGRCVRLLKLMDIHPEGSPRLNIIIKSFKVSAPSLILLLGIVLVSAVVFGSLIYTAEHGTFRVTPEYPDGEYFREDIMGEWEVTPFRNLGTCVYWAIVTMTTLGYGDLYPSTTAGRVVGAVCCIYGIICIAMPVTVVNNAFSSELNTYKSALKMAKKLHDKQVEVQERHERESISSESDRVSAVINVKSVSHHLVDIPAHMVRKSKMTSQGLFTVPFEKDRQESMKVGAEVAPISSPNPKRASPRTVEEQPAVGTVTSTTTGVPFLYREATKINLIAKEIALLKKTLSGLEETFDELCLEDSPHSEAAELIGPDGGADAETTAPVPLNEIE